jgi:uncharacterized protein YuzE
LRGGKAVKISYDKESDAMYIRLLEGDYECRVVRLTDEIALDFAAGEKLVGIEVLDASRLFKKPGVPVIELKNLLPQVSVVFGSSGRSLRFYI